MPPPIYLENHRSVRAFYFLFHIPVHRTEQQQHYSVILHHLLRKATEYTQQLTPNTTSVQVSRTLKALGEKGRLIGCLSNCFTFSNLSRQRRHPYAKEIDGGSDFNAIDALPTIYHNTLHRVRRSDCRR